MHNVGPRLPRYKGPKGGNLLREPVGFAGGLTVNYLGRGLTVIDPKHPQKGKYHLINSRVLVPHLHGVGKSGWHLLREMEINNLESQDNITFYKEIVVIVQ